MFTKAMPIAFAIFLLPNLYLSYGSPIPLAQSSVDVAGSIISVSVVAIVAAGLVFYFKKRDSLSKMLSTILIVVLLVLALSGTALTVLGSRGPEELALSELEVNLPGTTGYCIFQLADESFILNTANESHSFLIKLDSAYNEVWIKTIRIDQKDTVLDRLVPTSDGGYALAGIVNNQYILMKASSQGDVLWTATYNSGDPISFLRAMIQTQDGGFALAGFGEPEEEGLGWIWLAKTDAYGAIQWNKTLCGPVADCPSAIIQTPDGGYMMSDVSYSYVPDQGFFRLIKLDPDGNVLWNTTYGGEGRYLEPECNTAISTKDGGYLMGGYLWDTDAWVVKTDSQGNMQWNQTYGEKGSSITNILQTPNGGYLLGSISNFHTAGAILTDYAGNRIWNTTFTNVTWTIGYESNYNSIIPTKNGNYLMIGSKNQTIWLAQLNWQDNLQIALQSLSVANAALAVVVVITFLITLKKKRPQPNKHTRDNSKKLTAMLVD